MTPEERQVIIGIFERLKAAESQPRDPEAERLIADLVARQPYAPYAMAQSVYVGEQALGNLSRRVEELERELQEARSRAQPQSGGFLSGLFGGSRPEPQPPREPSPARAASPWGAPQQGYGQGQPGYAPAGQAYPPGGPMAGTAPQPGPWGGAPQGGGFLQSAMSTAAGVAGGMVLANVLSSAFSHHGGAGLGSGLGSGFGSPFGSSSGTSDASILGQGGEGFGGRGSGAQDFSGIESADRQDGSVRSGDNAGKFDQGRGADPAYDRSRDDRPQDDIASDHDQNDGGFSDDSGFSGDDPGFSGDV
jgi:hypothetical protein